MPRVTREEGQAIVESGMVIAGMSLVLIAFVIVTGLDGAFQALVEDIKAAFP
jgi:Flp pilus assembly pilin Flp